MSDLRVTALPRVRKSRRSLPSQRERAAWFVAVRARRPIIGDWSSAAVGSAEIGERVPSRDRRAVLVDIAFVAAFYSSRSARVEVRCRCSVLTGMRKVYWAHGLLTFVFSGWSRRSVNQVSTEIHSVHSCEHNIFAHMMFSRVMRPDKLRNGNNLRNAQCTIIADVVFADFNISNFETK